MLYLFLTSVSFSEICCGSCVFYIFFFRHTSMYSFVYSSGKKILCLWMLFDSCLQLYVGALYSTILWLFPVTSTSCLLWNLIQLFFTSFFLNLSVKQINRKRILSYLLSRLTEKEYCPALTWEQLQGKWGRELWLWFDWLHQC